MKLFLWIDGKETGPFEAAKVGEMLDEGSIALVTLSRVEGGKSDWKPISHYAGIIDLPHLFEPLPPPSAPANSQLIQPEIGPEKTEEVLFKESSVETSDVASALMGIAILELIASPIVGLIIGSGNTPESISAGLMIFTCGFTGGLILLGFAKLIEHSYESAQRMRRVESILLKATTDKNSV